MINMLLNISMFINEHVSQTDWSVLNYFLSAAETSDINFVMFIAVCSSDKGVETLI